MQPVLWRREAIGRVEVIFTGSGLDLNEPGAPERLSRLLDAPRIHRMRQVHGCAVTDLDDASGDGSIGPEADAYVVDRRGAAMARAADCVPVALVDPDRPLAAAVHAGRLGMSAGVVPAAVAELHSRGARTLQARVGPHACGSCYEVPEQMADEVAAQIPQARSTTSWGTPALDLGAGIAAQLHDAGVEVVDTGGCTIEDDAFFSYRRQGVQAGRHGVVVIVR